MDTDAQSPKRGHAPDPRRGAGRRPRFGRRMAAAGTVLVLLLLVNTFALQPFVIPSGSMENTLRVGDRVLVNKLAYRFGNDPGRGDVVVFDGTGSFTHEGTAPGRLDGLLRTVGAAVGLVTPPETDYVKRVVGIGGDRVVCCDGQGRIEVNGEPLDEEYLHPGDDPSVVPFDVVVPRGRLWVMGDHRSDSRDSRDLLGSPGGGMVPTARVIGRAEWILWPPGHWDALRHSPAGGGPGHAALTPTRANGRG